jgi:hypothetical protein
MGNDDWDPDDPTNDPAEWLSDVETGATEAVDELFGDAGPEESVGPDEFESVGEPYEDEPSAPSTSVLITATALLGAAAILVAVLRRRG